MDNGDLEKLLNAKVEAINAKLEGVRELADERHESQKEALKLALTALNKQSGPSVLISGIIGAAMGAIIAGVVWHALK